MTGVLLRRVVCATALALLAACVSVTPALALSPWWHLSSDARSNVQPGSAEDESQEVTVSATGGEFVLIDHHNEQHAFFKWNATAAEVQEGLEGIYGSGDVQVSGGPGDEHGTKPYAIEFVGALADQLVEPLDASFSSRFLEGPTAEATLKERSVGRPDGEVVLKAANLGDANAVGAHDPIQIVDTLPHGLRAVAAAATLDGGEALYYPAKCSLDSLTCRYEGTVPPYAHLEMRIAVVADGSIAADAANEARVSGGGAARVSVARAIPVSASNAPSGVESYELTPEEEGGSEDTQAGSHPFQLTTTLSLAQTPNTAPFEFSESFTPSLSQPIEPTKDLHFKLPPGLIGNPTQTPQCTLSQFLASANGEPNQCQPQTAVGVAEVDVNVKPLGALSLMEPLFNLEPAVGEPARFGFFVPLAAAPVILDTAVRTGGDYGVTVNVNNITETAGFLSSQVTFWGVPGDPRHDSERGWNCLNDDLIQSEPGGGENDGHCRPEEAVNPPPLLSLPTSCTGPLPTTVETDSWPHEGSFASTSSVEPLGALDGCNRLPFSPSIQVTPDGQAGSTPTGLTVDIHVPQDLVLNPTGLAEANVKDTTVALPAGVALNPAAADGLLSCAEDLVALASDTPPTCPDASKVATVQIKSPLLPNELEGEMYLAAQDANPFGSLVALYLVAQDPISGTLVKVAGEVKPDPVTGQRGAVFKNTPQLPFEDLKIHFFGGDRAPLATPTACGGYTTSASIAPWSGNPSAEIGSEFQIVSGPGDASCQSPPPFAPSLTAGTTSIQAGGFSPFTMTMSREDGQQSLQSIQLRMPPGLSGSLANVKLCDEADADAGTCGPESEIGETIVSVGVGSDPYSVRGGKVYMTGPYKGAPFGLSIVNPAKAGPFDLGQVVVRAKVEVDPSTAQLTITTDDSGPYKIPTIIDGIPLQIKHVNVTINRPGFTFNPTNCSPLAVTGTLHSSEGAAKDLAVPFQVTNCAVLAFRPKLTASTSGRTSRANGASLHVKLTYPAGPYDANISRVKVELPKALPSRLTTLQKACTAAVFEANPANCPAASVIGHATATTPVLPVPLTGPAIFVSHGNEAFPSLNVVLQGYGVTVHLVGSTFISKTGITSSTFKTVPDVPVGTFELTLPQGPYSALTANTSLCKSKLTMPTEFVGQNGALLKTTTKIQTTGCPKAKKPARRKRTRKGKRTAKHGRKQG